MRKAALTDHDAAKRAAQYLLSHGLATYAEIATLTGLSRQAVRQWGIESARHDYLAKLWRDALRQKHE